MSQLDHYHIKKLFILLFYITMPAECLAEVLSNLWTHPDRIPILCVAPNSALLAFAEDRIIITNNDGGYINCTLRRSLDNGVTWTLPQTIVTDGTNTFSCGAAVVDVATGKIFFFTGWSLFGDGENAIDNGTAVNTKHIFVLTSSDNGTNWSTPVDISASVKHRGWNWCDPGPATGLQLDNGRLIVPFYYSTGLSYYPSVMYSDDHGATWQSSNGATNNVPGYNECSVAALTNGVLMMIARNNTANPGKMGIATSSDLGLTWSAMTNSGTLNDPGCEGCLIRYTKPPYYGKARLLFSNPPQSISGDRSQLAVRVSYDEGNSWTVAKPCFLTLSAYSALTILSNGNWAILGENGTNSYFDHITFISDTLSNLTSGVDQLDPLTNLPPVLTITASGPNVVVAWPTSLTNALLLQNNKLTSNGWVLTGKTNIAQVGTGQYQLRFTPTNSSRFFRLTSP